MMSVDGTIFLRLDGEHRRMRQGLGLASLASALDLVPEKIAVEHDLELVSRSTLAEVLAEDGNELAIMHFFGGG